MDTMYMKINNKEDLEDFITKSLKHAFQLGQTYWRQANSEYYSQNKKSEETYTKFLQLEENTVIVLDNAVDEISAEHLRSCIG